MAATLENPLDTEKRFERICQRTAKSASNPAWRFEEILSSEEKRDLIEQRNFHYARSRIRDAKIGYQDPFDEYARFFVMTKDRRKPVLSKAIRVVRRDNELGILPSELSLMNAQELDEFLKFFGNSRDESQLTESTLNPEDREKFKRLLEQQNPSKTYEIGGLFGIDSHLKSPLALILGISQISYNEDWQYGIQTVHPRHVLGYERILPFQRIAGNNQTYLDEKSLILKKGYLDHFERPAITLGIQRDDFRAVYEEKLAELVKNLFKS
jgi:hypothetical protein